MESEGKAARLAVEQMLIVPQLAKPASHGVFTKALHAISEVVPETSLGNAVSRAAVLLQELSFKLLWCQLSRRPCNVVQNFELREA